MNRITPDVRLWIFQLFLDCRNRLRYRAAAGDLSYRGRPRVTLEASFNNTWFTEPNGVAPILLYHTVPFLRFSSPLGRSTDAGWNHQLAAREKARVTRTHTLWLSGTLHRELCASTLWLSCIVNSI